MIYDQQGDVLIVGIDAIPEGAKKIDSKILAEGEATGHAHTIIGDVQVFDFEGKKYVWSESEFVLHHTKHGAIVEDFETRQASELHEPITFPPGAYEIDSVQEYDWLDKSIQKVRD